MCSFYAGRLKKPSGQLKGEPCSTLETELHVKDGSLWPDNDTSRN